jgi:hypothetical protein
VSHPLVDLYRRSPAQALAAYRQGEAARVSGARAACADLDLSCDVDGNVIPATAGRRQGPLVSFGEPLPTDPGDVLAHFLALDELHARARARLAEACDCGCGGAR